MTRDIHDEIRGGLQGDAVGFLSQNMVLMGLSGHDPVANSLVRGFEFAEAYRTRSGGAVFKPVRDDLSGAEAPVFFYYMPWSVGAEISMVLDPREGPDLMFTATLTGCAVGYERAADGAVRLSHYDLCRPGQERGVQTSGAMTRRDGFFADEDGVALIYGVRTYRHWAIYAQRMSFVQTITQPGGKTRLEAEIREVRAF
ncbi:hypothetical protein [Acidocella sp.]|uniref:hypothetical protein n=1 Tax=Acidocella sp. TaxID=50710 RepID=UPI0026373C58|nr:hypothetical protein [Acidocella sp.]